MSRLPRVLALVVIAALVSVPAEAQWLHQTDSTIPRTKDGRPNLSARAPKTAEGKPDLSGVWAVEPPDDFNKRANDTFAAYKFSNPWFGTVRGRAGYAMNNVLIYGTGGFAYGGGTVSFGAISSSQTHTGWTVGAGVEVGLTQNWSAKAEYLYLRLDDQSYVLTGLNNGFQSNLFRLGVNYRF